MEPMSFSNTETWWPAELGSPSSSGSQNDVHYAYFRGARCLLLRQGDEVTTYDTGEHEIYGVQQASDTAHARFTSDQGEVDVASLKKL